MRINNENKGQMRVVEAILASFVIIFALTFVNFFAVAPTSQKYALTDLEYLGYNSLYDLDQQGILPRLIYNEDWSRLRDALSVILPTDVYFNVTVTDLDNNPINDNSISYGNAEIFRTSETVVSIFYATTGYSNYTLSSYDYNPRIINIQLVRG